MAATSAMDSAHANTYIEITPFTNDSVGFACTYVREPRGTVTTQGWFVAIFAGDDLPRYSWEVSVLHALFLTKGHLRGYEEFPKYVSIKAGGLSNYK